jgi:transcriptional regulator with XRE-family HTH domain
MQTINTATKECFQQCDTNTLKYSYIFAIFVLIIYNHAVIMNSLGDRIKEIRKQKGWSQNELSQKAGVSYAQLSRYEIKGSQPPAEVLNKLADALDTTVDYLINGDTNEKAKSTLKDAELLQQFKAVEQMNDDDRSVIKKVIGAFVTQSKIRQIAI